jgi:hypothetical protein
MLHIYKRKLQFLTLVMTLYQYTKIFKPTYQISHPMELNSVILHFILLDMFMLLRLQILEEYMMF